MGNNLQKSSYPGDFLSDGNRVEAKKKLPIFVILFFTNVGPDVANRITVPDDVTVLDYLTSKNTKSMFLSPADENEVISLSIAAKAKHLLTVMVLI